MIVDPEPKVPSGEFDHALVEGAPASFVVVDEPCGVAEQVRGVIDELDCGV
jgi:hypothetical protein